MREKSKPQTILDKNVKSQRILTKLRALNFEYIDKKLTKFSQTLFINSGVINLQILITKYISFHCDNWCSHWSGSNLCLQDYVPAHRARSAVRLRNTRLHRLNSLASQQF